MNTELETLSEELHSNLNRVKIALVLVELGRTDLLPTALEDLLYYVQEIVERHCIVGVQNYKEVSERC